MSRSQGSERRELCKNGEMSPDMQGRLKALIRKMPDAKLDMADVQSLALSVFYDIQKDEAANAPMKKVQVEALRLLSETLKEENKDKREDNSMNNESLLLLLKK